MTQALYNPTLHSLDELPGMEKPKEPSSDTYLPCEYESYNNDTLRYKDSLCKYNAHIARLRKNIPVDESARGMWADKATLTDGKEYELRKWCKDPELCCISSCDCKEWAFPITGQGEEDNWKEFMNIIYEGIRLLKLDHEMIQELKSKYSITKK